MRALLRPLPSAPARAACALGLVACALLLAACTLAGPRPPGPLPAGASGTGGPADRSAEPAAPEGEEGPGNAGRRAAAPAGEEWRFRPLPPPVTSPFPEVRGLWVVRFSLASPESVRAVVERAHEGGFNTLLVQVRGRGDAWYWNGLEPAAEPLREQPPGFDPLALLVREAHARGIHVHAWINTFLVAGVGPLPTDPRHVVNARPEWLAVPRELARELHRVDPASPYYAERLRGWASERTDRVEGLYVSPANPRVQEHVYRIALDLVSRYDLDGLHLDYVRYPDAGFDHSRGSLEAFREWMAGRVDEELRLHLDELYRADPLALTGSAPDEWDDFRRSQVTGLVERVVRGVKARRPDLLVSAAVFPDAAAARAHRFQDWREWLEAGLLDVAVPMAYAPDGERFREQVADARAGIGRERVWAGIGVYRTTLEGTLRNARIARQEGAGGLVLFSYDWAVAEGESPDGVPFLTRVGRELF